MRLTSLHEIAEGVSYQTEKRTFRPRLEQIEEALKAADMDNIMETKVISGSTILLVSFLDNVMMYGAPPNGTAATVQNEVPSQVETAA
ncbi:MAG: hypothetical protein HYY96_08500 [Candidatus Tectomicrobia bacterium]|nr:hypothetical protein [Candidatus Tectomicrobia bacterium]